MGSTWAVLNALWRRKDTKPIFQMFQINFDIFNNNILLVSMANNQITITAVTVIEPIAVDLNLQLRSTTIILKSIKLFKIESVYWYVVCITKVQLQLEILSKYKQSL